jgi:hypothetical protein
MTTYLPIPENLVGKIVQSRFDETIGNLSYFSKETILIALTRFIQTQNFIDPSVELTSQIYNEDTINVKSHTPSYCDEDGNITSCSCLHNFITIQCVYVEFGKFSLKIDSCQCDQSLCDEISKVIANELFAENSQSIDQVIYIHSLF